MSKSLADNGFITEMKDKNGDSWYHQIVLEEKDKEIERLNNIIKEVRELLNQEWYSVLRKETIRKVREILDKINGEE